MEPRSNTEVSNPNLIFDLVSGYLCPKILQRCRLVCKSWNQIACGILKKSPVVFSEGWLKTQQQECNQRLSHFLDLLESRPDEISHPFRKISIKGRILRKNFCDLLMGLEQYNDIEICNLEFQCRNYGKELSDLKRKIMAWAQSTLTSLSLTIKSPFDVNQFEWKFEKLETLEIIYRKDYFSGGPIEDSLKTLLENILRWPKLGKLSLKINVDDFDLLKKLLPDENLKRVLSLELPELVMEINQPEKNNETIRCFTQNSFPNVKNLSIEGDVMYSMLLIEIFSQSLEILTYFHGYEIEDTPIPLDVFPTCPQLRELDIEMGACIIKNSFSEKFPSLKKISCEWGLKIVGEVSPHFGVEYLNFNVDSDNFNNSVHNSEICTCCKIGRDILHHFPHLNQDIYQPKAGICSEVETLWSTVKCFPNVKALKIENCGELIRFVSEIGTTVFKDDVMDVRFQNVFRDLFPLENFRKMKSLDLSESRVKRFTPAIIRLGLGKIPALKYLALPYDRPSIEYDNETLEAMRECLEDLKQLQFALCKKRSPEAYENREALKAKLFPLAVNWFCYIGDCHCEMRMWCQHCKTAYPFDFLEHTDLLHW